MSQKDGDVTDQRKARVPQRVEWVVGGVSAVFVAAMIGFLLVDAVVREGRPPELTAGIERIEPTSGGAFRVVVRIANGGDLTAAGVEVEGVLAGPDGGSETSAVTLDYVPAHSSVPATLLFAGDPRRQPLAVTARGFAEP